MLLFLFFLGTKYQALDGCSTNPANLFKDGSPGYYLGTSEAAEIQCCSSDGSSCSRKKSSECRSGNDDDKKFTWAEANQHCIADGKRLCRSQDEVNKCCNGGCNYDNQLVWSSIVEGMIRRC